VLLGCRWAGETIGEMAVLEEQPRSASVVALERLELLGIDRQNFVRLLRESPSFSYGLMQMLSARLRQTSEIVQRETMDKMRDPLTGLYNRRYLEDALVRELAQAVRGGYPLSLVMLDIDRFKAVNDSYGHAAGDRVLQALGDLLRRHVRRGDLACRYGGEEFVVILPSTPLEVAQRRAEELRLAYAGLSVEYQGQALSGSLSLGVAACPAHTADAAGLLAAADAALYAAKRQGRNRVVVAT
ncbi:MAG: GGDEF domain-containing protein, partial [Anaerolineales bacterium]|nr:GGDEF domain-containing protein [Anaerolineales bacterium]